MYKIGFIDYYLSEWHANNYPTWFQQIKELGEKFQVAYAYAEIDKSPLDGVTTDEWCEKYGVQKVNSIQELCEKSDFIVILAPSNPETHLHLCREAFRYGEGKRMYIDKTFAPDLTTAKEIFVLAEQHGVKFFSTSALRYCSDYKDLKLVKSISTAYGGSNLEEYIIHQIESIVKVMGVRAEKLKAEKDGDTVNYEVVFSDGRSAFMSYNSNHWYHAKIEFTDGSIWEQDLASGHFVYLSEKILRFFDSGEIDFDTLQTLDVMAIRDKAIMAKENTGRWLLL